MSTEDKTSSLKDLLNRIIEGKIDANRTYVDEVLEKIQDANNRYYLQKLVVELVMMEMEEKAGDKQAAFQRSVMVDTYKSILEKTIGIT